MLPLGTCPALAARMVKRRYEPGHWKMKAVSTKIPEKTRALPDQAFEQDRAIGLWDGEHFYVVTLAAMVGALDAPCPQAHAFQRCRRLSQYAYISPGRSHNEGGARTARDCLVIRTQTIRAQTIRTQTIRTQTVAYLRTVRRTPFIGWARLCRRLHGLAENLGRGT
ncbi:hypothetical protein B0H17DRAFT_1123517 [Mycena rosella]|uniref:Uncharacterized protein n=1 Tax=Mycena rosella TaxID=1033263 RepID=A0AAD7MCQ3_MYCRO|nr:hypothetical protein B0H17DRAFT_1123517 [Mycena rosella]